MIFYDMSPVNFITERKIMNMFTNKINRPKWMENKYMLPMMDAFITAFLSDRIFDVLENPPKHFKQLQLTEVSNIKKWLTFYKKEVDDISLENRAQHSTQLSVLFHRDL